MNLQRTIQWLFLAATAALLMFLKWLHLGVTNYNLFFGEFLYFLGAALLILSLRWGELSVVYPIYALNFIWVGILSPYFFASDTMTPLKWAGVLLVVGGVALVGLGSRGEKEC